MLETPIAFLVFNRPETTRRVFESIRNAQPARLLLVADGPRPDKAGEDKLCNEVREIISRVDWPCEVLTNFSDKNLGCGQRIITGLDWVFSQVEEAIVLEDDCLPDPSFFSYCQQLLERYRHDTRVAYISACSLRAEYLKSDASYYFSRIGGIWGWATWRSQWQRYDPELTDWPTLKKEKMLAEVFDSPRIIAYWTRIFDEMYEKRGDDTWDYQWLYTTLKNNSVVACPRVNLITNIGFGTDATHTLEAEPRFMVSSSPLEFPLRHPASLVPLQSMDNRIIYPASRPTRAARKIARTVGRFFG
jgi:hypothetical protein